MILVYFQKGFLLGADHLCELHQLQLVVLTLLSDLTVLPGNLKNIYIFFFTYNRPNTPPLLIVDLGILVNLRLIV